MGKFILAALFLIYTAMKSYYCFEYQHDPAYGYFYLGLSIVAVFVIIYGIVDEMRNS
jgi:hypothetical protein